MNIDRIEVDGTEYNVEDKAARESIQTLAQGMTESINAINAVIPDNASTSNMLAVEKSINVPVLNITARSGTVLTATLLAESAGNTFHNGQIVEVLISENVIISTNGWYTFTGSTANATNLQNVIGNIATGAGETKKVVGVFRNNNYIDLLYEVNPPTSVVASGNNAPVTSGGVYNGIKPTKITGDLSTGIDISSLAPYNSAVLVLIDTLGNAHQHSIWIGVLTNFDTTYSFSGTKISNSSVLEINVSSAGILTAEGTFYNGSVTVLNNNITNFN